MDVYASSWVRREECSDCGTVMEEYDRCWSPPICEKCLRKYDDVNTGYTLTTDPACWAPPELEHDSGKAEYQPNHDHGYDKKLNKKDYRNL